MSRIAVALAVAAASGGCLVDANYDGSSFRCGASGECPDGFECRGVSCAPIGVFDAGPDAIGSLVLPPFALSTPVPGLSANGAIDDDLSLTDDLLVAVFNSDRGGTADIWTSTRGSATSPFPTPARVAELSSVSSESTPVISDDGLAILFASNRPGGLGGMDVYKSARASTGALWGTVTIVSELNSASDDFVSWLSPDLLTAIIHSNRAGSFDLYMTTRATRAGPFDSPVGISEINTTSGELGARLLAGGLLLTYHSTRTGGGDLYYALRETVDDPFEQPIALEGPNTAEAEEDAWLAANLCFLTFSRTVSGGTTIFQTTCLPR